METTLQQMPINKKKKKNNNKDKGYQLKLFARMLWVGVGFRGVKGAILFTQFRAIYKQTKKSMSYKFLFYRLYAIQNES